MGRSRSFKVTDVGSDRKPILVNTVVTIWHWVVVMYITSEHMLQLWDMVRWVVMAYWQLIVVQGWTVAVENVAVTRCPAAVLERPLYEDLATDIG